MRPRHDVGAVQRHDSFSDSFLDDCLVDSVSKSKRSRKPVRRRAVALALVFEAAMVSGLALWPLLTAARLAPGPMLIERIPDRISLAPVSASRPSGASRSQPVRRETLFSPPIVPPVIFRSPIPGPQIPTAPPIDGFGPGTLAAFPNLGGFGLGSLAAAPAKPAAAPTRVVSRSEHEEEGQLLRRVIPAYPEIARLARISGTVELLVLVGRDGRVKYVQALSGNPLLAASARAGVEQWRYRPAILDGQAVEVETHVTVHFVLNE
ncbi:MAG TPA: energy transducer TonB [Candidatus Acidoferrales bacterium]|nr:energy transducer TonB [Candidatus Acidoferrales bacterium]